jgi:hypothetical protein
LWTRTPSLVIEVPHPRRRFVLQEWRASPGPTRATTAAPKPSTTTVMAMIRGPRLPVPAAAARPCPMAAILLLLSDLSGRRRAETTRRRMMMTMMMSTEPPEGRPARSGVRRDDYDVGAATTRAVRRTTPPSLLFLWFPSGPSGRRAMLFAAVVEAAASSTSIAGRKPKEDADQREMGEATETDEAGGGSVSL